MSATSNTIKVIALVSTIIYLALSIGGFIEPDNRLSNSEIVLIVVIALLCSGAYEAIKELKVGNIEAKFERIEHRQKDHEARLAGIQIALRYVVTKYELDKMKQLNQSGDFLVWFTDDFFRK